MEPKVIGAISNNLELVRKIAERKNDDLKNTLNEVLSGDIVQNIVNSSLEKLDAITVEFKTTGKKFKGIDKLVSKLNDMIQAQASYQKNLMSMLSEINGNAHALVKKAVTTKSSPENQKMIKGILGNIQKDGKLSVLLSAALLGCDLVKNLASIKKFEKGAHKGIDVLESVIFGDGKKKKGLLKLYEELEKRKKELKDITKTLEALGKAIKTTFYMTLMLAGIALLGIPAMVGVVMVSAIVWLLSKLMDYLDLKKIEKGGKALQELGRAYILIGISLAIITLLVKSISFGTFVTMVAILGVMILGTYVVSQYEEDINKGSKVMWEMAKAYLLIGLALVVLTQLVASITIGTFITIVAIIGVMILGAYVVGQFENEIDKGTRIMLYMGLAYIAIGLALVIITHLVAALTIGTFITVVAVIGVMVLGTILTCYFVDDIDKGSEAMLKLGIAYLLMSLSLAIITNLVQSVSIGVFITVAVIIGIMIFSAKFVADDAEKIMEGAFVLAVLAVAFLVVSLSLWVFGKATEDMDFGAAILGVGIVLLLVGVALVAGALSEYLLIGAVVLMMLGVAFLLVGIGVKSLAEATAIINFEGAVALCGFLVMLLPVLLPWGVLFPIILLATLAMFPVASALKKLGEGVSYFDKVKESAFTKITTGIPAIKDAMKCGIIESIKLVAGAGVMKSVASALLLLGKSLAVWAKVPANVGTIISQSLTGTCVGLAKVSELLEDYDDIDETVWMLERALRPLKKIKNSIEGWEKIDPEGTKKMGKVLQSAAKGLMYLKNYDEDDFDEVKDILKAMKKAFKPLQEIKESLTGWEDVSPEGVKNIGSTLRGVVSGLMSVIKLDEDQLDDLKDKLKDIKKAFKPLQEIKESLTGWDDIGKTAIDNISYIFRTLPNAILSVGKNFEKNKKSVIKTVKTLDEACKPLGNIKNNLKGWEQLQVEPIMDNIKYVLRELPAALGQVDFWFLIFGKTIMRQVERLAYISKVMGELHKNLSVWSDFDRNAIANFKYVHTELTEYFGLNDSGGGGFSIRGIFQNAEALAGMALTAGKELRRIGILLTIAIGMKSLYQYLMIWKDFDLSALVNFKVVHSQLTDYFGLDDKSAQEKSSWSGRIDNIEALAGMSMQSGKELKRLGILLTLCIGMSRMFDALYKWKNFDLSAITNFKVVHGELTEYFGLDDKSSQDRSSWSGRIDNIEALAGMSMQSGKELRRLGILLTLCIGMSRMFDALYKWKNFDLSAIGNFKQVHQELTNYFGLDDSSAQAGFSISGCIGNLEAMAGMTMQAGKEFRRLGILLTMVVGMSRMYDGLYKWKNFDMRSIDMFEQALTRLQQVFDNNDFDVSWWKCWRVRDMLRGLGYALDDFSERENEFRQFAQVMDPVSKAFAAVDMINGNGLERMTNSLEKLTKIVSEQGPLFWLNSIFTTNLLKQIAKVSETAGNGFDPFNTFVDKVNTIKLENVMALTDMFKSFSKLREKSIFSAFSNSVDDFVDACVRLIDAINGNTDALNAPDESGEEGGEEQSQNKKGTPVRINNIDELAQAIAHKMGGGRGVSGGFGGMTTVDLRINGTSGDQWIIRKY